MIQFSHVLTQNGLAFAAQCKSGLHLPANSQRGNRAFKRQLNRLRRIAARAADWGFHIAYDPRHRIIAANMNPAVVSEKHVGDIGKPIDGIWLLISDRLIRAVSAGHHQLNADVAQQQMMQRVVYGSITPKCELPGAIASGRKVAGRFFIRTMGRREEISKSRSTGQISQSDSAAETSREHEGERLFIAMLSPAEFGHRL